MTRIQQPQLNETMKLLPINPIFHANERVILFKREQKIFFPHVLLMMITPGGADSPLFAYLSSTDLVKIQIAVLVGVLCMMINIKFMKVSITYNSIISDNQPIELMKYSHLSRYFLSQSSARLILSET